MLNNLFFLLALFATVTGISLPQVIAKEYSFVPTVTETNEPSLALLPKPVLRTQPERIDSDLGPTLPARAAIVLDKASGAVLWQKNQDQSYSVASLTKLMTMVVAQDKITDWEQPYTLQWADMAVGNSIFPASAGDTFSKHDLLKAALVGSINQAAQAVAHSTGLSDADFMQAMNDKATSLGMTHTHYVEPTGLRAGNQSSARDIALLFRTITAYPLLMEPLGQTEHRMADGDREIAIDTTNELLKRGDPYTIAGKTGFTDEAGACLAVVTRNAAGHELVVVVLGAPDLASRFTEAHDLADWAYTHYRW